MQFGDDALENGSQFFELVGHECRAAGFGRERGHVFLPLEADLIQADRRPAGIDGIEEGIGALQFTFCVNVFMMLTVVILAVRDNYHHAPRARIGSIAQVVSGFDNGIEESSLLLRWLDSHQSGDGFFKFRRPRAH